MSQRTGLMIGIVSAICGTFVLGADRLTASADAGSYFGQSMTVYTVIGLVILALAAAWLFFFKPKSKID